MVNRALTTNPAWHLRLAWILPRSAGGDSCLHLLVFFIGRIFAADRAIVEIEHAAHDRQGEDLNQEVFLAIPELRGLLAACGTSPS